MEKNFSRIFGVDLWGLGLFSSVLSPCWPSEWLLQGWRSGAGQDRVALGLLGGAGDVWGKLLSPSSIPATFGMVWEVAHGSVHSL